MPEISVIVPVYNVEKYLPRCIESILNQTFTDFELILVDDGSIDRSGDICDEYAVLDNRIHVFHKENGGVSSARNLGLYNVKGEWITFIDSDDWIEEEYIQSFFIENTDVNTLQIQLYKLYYNDKREFINTFINAEYSLSMQDNIENFDILSFTGVCCKLYSSSIIKDNNIIFDNKISLGEDGLFFYEYLLYVEKIKVLNIQFYNYRKELENSLSTQIHELDNILYYLNLKSKYIIELTLKFDLSRDYINSKVANNIMMELFSAIYNYIFTKCNINSLVYKIKVENQLVEIINNVKYYSFKRFLAKTFILFVIKKQ